MKKCNLNFFWITIPFLIAYVIFVLKTPNHIYWNSSPVWLELRIIVILYWIFIIYRFRWKNDPKKSWHPHFFLQGLIAGGGFAIIILLLPKFYRSSANQYIGTFSAYSFISGLWASPEKKSFHGLLAGFSCLLYQLLIDFLCHIWWGYVV